MKASCAPDVHTSSEQHLCQSTALGRGTLATPIPSSCGEGEGTRAQPIPLPPQGSTGDNQHRQPWGRQSTCTSLPVWEGQEYRVIFTFLRLQACRVRPSSLFRFWHLSNSRAQKSLGYRGLTQGLMQRISSHQGSFHRLSIWAHSSFPHFFCLQFSTKYIDIDLEYGGKEGKKEETSMWMTKKFDTALQSSGAPFFNHKERKLMMPQV